MHGAAGCRPTSRSCSVCDSYCVSSSEMDFYAGRHEIPLSPPPAGSIWQTAHNHVSGSSQGRSLRGGMAGDTQVVYIYMCTQGVKPISPINEWTVCSGGIPEGSGAWCSHPILDHKVYKLSEREDGWWTEPLNGGPDIPAWTCEFMLRCFGVRCDDPPPRDCRFEPLTGVILASGSSQKPSVFFIKQTIVWQGFIVC